MAEDINNSLFSQDVLDSMESGNSFNQVKSGPVTVLGRTFANDEERRAYFREELRKKLPELKKIEGYPIGEDEDIIALSDPPYYTACPNPWLNEFIASWEKEKKQLVAKGKRIEEKVVTEPYASDVSEGKNNPIYNAHTYHTKVPHPAIMRYILHYTEPGDIIFDGFCGTGMTGVASSICGTDEINSLGQANVKKGHRHCICSDLSPIASFIASVYNSEQYPESFKKKAAKILESVEGEYGWMYETKDKYGNKGIIQYVVWTDVFICPNCGNEIVFFDSATEDKSGVKCPHCGGVYKKNQISHAQTTEYDPLVGDTVSLSKMIPVLIKYRVGKKSYLKEPSAADLELIKKIDSMPNSSWCPSNELIEGFNTQQPMKANGINYVHQFYSKRNLFLLSKVYEKIAGDKALLLWFTSQLVNISKLNRYRPEVSFPYNPLNGTLYISSQICESNIFDAYNNKTERMAKAFALLHYNNIVGVNSATSVPLNDCSVDYIFTDPPFGANIMYSDLNCIWEGWIKVRTDNREEAIVNSYQNKTLFEYQELMNRSLKEYYRILKPGKWLTMEFSNTSASVWNSIQNALQGVGFIVANVAALDKQQGSFKAVTTPTAVKQDLIITCFKPSESFTIKFDNVSIDDPTQSIWDFTEEYLVHLPVHIEKEHKTTTVIERSPKILYDRLITYYVQKGLPVPIDSTDFQNGLRERFEECDGMFFTPSQLVEYREKKKLAPEFVPMGLIVSNEADGIEWLRNRLREESQTYQDIQPDWMQAISGIRKGDILPELSELLEENFIEESGGKWRLPNIQDDVDKDKLREKALLKEFKVYVDAASKPRARIKEVRVEAIRAGFKKCYMEKDFATIVMVGDKIPQNLLTEDDILLQFYDIARTRV